jgi:hypothetical protein
MFPNVSDLQRRGVVQLMLHGDIPLLHDRGLHVRIPQAENRAGKGIGGCLDLQTLVGGDGRQIGREVLILEFRTERRIQRRPQVCAGAFLIGRHRVCAANHGLVIQECRAPCKAYTRLEVIDAVVAVI